MKFDYKDPKFLGSIFPFDAPSDDAYVAIRDAADLGTVAMRVSTEYAWDPSAEAPWAEGDEFAWTRTDPTATSNYMVAAARPAKAGVIVRSGVVYLKPSHRYEFILLGTKASNAKMIAWKRYVTMPPGG